MKLIDVLLSLFIGKTMICLIKDLLGEKNGKRL